MAHPDQCLVIQKLQSTYFNVLYAYFIIGLNVRSHYGTYDRRVSLYFTMGRPFSSKNLPLPMGGSEPASNTWFFGPTQVLNPNGSSIGAAVFAGLTSVTGRQTDRPTTLLGR